MLFLFVCLLRVQTSFFILLFAADLAVILMMRRPFLLRWPSVACKDLSHMCSQLSNDIILKLIWRTVLDIHLISQDQALHAVQTEAAGSVRVPSERRHEGIPLQRPSHAGPDRGPPAGLGPPAGSGAQDCGNVCEEAGRDTSADHRLCRVIQSNYKPPRRKRQVTEPEEPGFEEISAIHCVTDSVLYEAKSEPIVQNHGFYRHQEEKVFVFLINALGLCDIISLNCPKIDQKLQLWDRCQR